MSKLLNSDDFVRHFSASRMEGDKPLAGSLRIPPDHNGAASINRLFHFHDDIEADLTEIRNRSRLTLRASGKLVRWNVGDIRDVVSVHANLASVDFIDDPLDPEENYPEDPSHSLLVGFPSDTLLSDFLLDLMRPHIVKVYPAKTS